METVFLPVVCTRGVVIFPSQDIIIDVGRAKSIFAVEEAQSRYNNRIFLVAQKDLNTEDPQPDELYETGTVCEIEHLRRMDGYLRIKFRGVARAKIVELEYQDDTINGRVSIQDEIENSPEEEIALVRRVAAELESIENIKESLPPTVVERLAKGVSAQMLTDQLSQIMPFSLEDKQRLLEMNNVTDRLIFLLEELAKAKRINEIDDLISEKVKQRLDDNQREYYLREKMRAIKEELGDVSDGVSDADDYREMVNNNPYPENIKKKALEEISRFEMLPAASGESGVVKSYLDWLLKLPWWQESQDNDDLTQAQAVLDEDHFGLDKPKERIMEYLAVKQMTNSLKAPIICLVGPPGVGKTSISKSVARALNREFVKISLGGVKDEAEIRGHRRTYLGSLPGRFIQGMKKAGSINPVFLIDEIDKMASDYKGDPSSAMLEVLDPEQNEFFSDHYLEEPYDLSKVLFIATANYIDGIPPALKDRLEVIELSSYTEMEKLEIAKRHLLRKQLKANGLKANQLKISDEMLLYIIRYYTREAGVRQLERLIGKLCRKTVLAILKDGKRSQTMSKKLINEYLGKEIFEYGRKESKNQIGTVTGLAYTSFGGDVLQIEVNHFDGKGKLIITGQLGDVMKESAAIAMDYVKANAKKYQIDPSIFEKQDIHIHVPEGAVPKDGPSAGVTLTTAIVSCLSNKAVHNDIAMTGEVTLRGHVLPIGGLKEKSLAAHRSGIKTIIIPKGNKKDIDDLPQVVKDNITFVPVDNVSQVIKEAIVA